MKNSKLVAPALVLVLLLFLQSLSFGQELSSPLFTLHGDSPIITRGAEGEWDSGSIFAVRVLHIDDVFHLFYVATDSNPYSGYMSLGYASSSDGLSWTKYENNPVLELDPDFASNGIMFAVPFYDNDQWTLFIEPHYYSSWGYGTDVITATSDAPTGPWEINTDKVLETGLTFSWNTGGVEPMSVIQEDDTIHFYYAGLGIDDIQLGLLTSSDGLEWTAYQDETTDEAAYRDSDPVFGMDGATECDKDGINFPYIVRTEDNWELFYVGTNVTDYGEVVQSICYATSEDGINWTRQGDTTVLDLGSDYSAPIALSVVRVDDTYFAFFTSFDEWDVWLATAPAHEN